MAKEANNDQAAEPTQAATLPKVTFVLPAEKKGEASSVLFANVSPKYYNLFRRFYTRGEGEARTKLLHDAFDLYFQAAGMEVDEAGTPVSLAQTELPFNE